MDVKLAIFKEHDGQRYRLTLVRVELTLPDRFQGEPFRKTMTQNPPAGSGDQAASSHSQIPVCASNLENRKGSP